MRLRAVLPLLLGAGALSSCSGRLPDPGTTDRIDDGVVSVYVTITQGDRGSVEAPLAFSDMGVPFTAHIEVHDNDGNVVTGFNGFLSLSVTPGALLNVQGANGSLVVGRSVQLTGGAADVSLTFARAYGESRIWAEDDGYTPGDPNDPDHVPACANGVDDDNDHRTDFPADYGCAAPNDDSEQGGSYALGASEPIYFDTPTIYQVQGGAVTSPLVNERIQITHGNLIITRVSVQGFWVTDTADHSCAPDATHPMGTPCYNSLFAFNFSLPAGLRACDRLLELEGSIAEFVGTTQLAQPSWQADPAGLWIGPDPATCPIPDPVAIDPSLLTNASTSLEPFESSVVRATNLVFSPNVGPAHPTCDASGNCQFMPGASNCDYNGDGAIDYSDPREGPCGNACQVTVGCSEWSNWNKYGQVAVDFMSGQPAGVNRLVIAPRDALPTFNPQAPPVNTPVTVTGTLSQVGPTWIIEPRCTQDIALDNMPGDVRATCVFPRAQDDSP